MKINLNVDVRHLSRVEGHGNIKIQVENGKLLLARWDTIEPPRFFEVMLKNKHYTTAALLAARICGICSISHCLCSLQATENAFGVTIPRTAQRLRRLAKHGETLQSHLLHILFLAAPDFLSIQSVIPLIEKQPELMAVALRLKGLANQLCDTVAGRSTHPIALQVGGVTRVPKKKKLTGLREDFKKALKDLNTVADLYAAFTIPDFIRETEFVSIKGENEYPFMGKTVISSDGVVSGKKDYLRITNEYVDKNNTSKWTKLSRKSYVVGALARYNNNNAWLHPEAATMAASLGLTPVCHNPFMNTMAQIVECFHVVHEILQLIDELVDCDPENPMVTVSPRAGEGVGAVEAPRGTLFHHYRYDRTGRLEMANCVVPTTQNNANIHYDIEALVKKFAMTGEITDKKLEFLSSMLVRAYDPCLSCSVH